MQTCELLLGEIVYVLCVTSYGRDSHALLQVKPADGTQFAVTARRRADGSWKQVSACTNQ